MAAPRPGSAMGGAVFRSLGTNPATFSVGALVPQPKTGI
jgi:hypothetical protein